MTSLSATLSRERDALLGTIAWLSDAALDCPNVVGERSIKDVLAHLAGREEAIVQCLREWHGSGGMPDSKRWLDPDGDDVDCEHQRFWAQASPTEQVLALERVRSDLLRVLADIGEQTLASVRPWPGWDITAAEYILDRIAEHEHRHCAAIRAAVSRLSESLEYGPGLRASREMALATPGPCKRC